ncbi:gas vesicle protein GvpJ [Natronolimnohabitans innermongolicus]|uniref:Gas vesicle protein GvpA n=1 Tax=Natronolimnohabitans innermongolicus JCM 12255 TaxID=1227499 RepID=L9WTS9_9EURY|nr:gas vesicle protein [Natronolimnohabitans innermongolicus]ELY51743.1 gas vesicle protein GvpA [Natronolimnohabitans innermongolicus JCM 12255]
MVDDFQPSRQKADLAEVVEMLLDKGIVINADIAVSIGDTQLLGVQVRAAIASFETAAKYGLEFPEGTDMRRVAAAVDDPELAEMERPNPAIDPTRSVNVTPDEAYEDDGGSDGTDADADGSNDSNDSDDQSYRTPDRGTEHVGARPDPEQPTSGGFDLLSDDDDGDADAGTGGNGDGDDDSDGGGDDSQASANAEGENA